jgi:4-hydroxybenzoate polyprenyltransferase
MSAAIGPVLYSNLFISICAAALAFAFGAEMVYCAFLFCGTFCAYGLNMLSGMDGLRSSGTQSIRHLWWLANGGTLRVLCILAATGAVGAMPFLGPHTLLLLSVPGTITLVYVLPLFYWRRRWVKLREVGVGKAFLIAAVWSALCAFIPLILSDVPLGQALAPSLSIALFILAITIPFDVRDLTNDVRQQISTLPLLLGERNALHLATGILAASCILMFVWADGGMAQRLSVLAVYAATAALIQLTDRNRGEVWYSLLLDGTILLLASALSFA